MPTSIRYLEPHSGRVGMVKISGTYRWSNYRANGWGEDDKLALKDSDPLLFLTKIQMKIEHIALWSKNIELLKEFYTKYFNASANDKYVNSTTGFESYFMSFDSGARLEIMQMATIRSHANDPIEQHIGLIHFAVSVGSKEKVDELTSVLKVDGYTVVDGPRITGDGYYESVVLDPEGNRIEIAV